MYKNYKDENRLLQNIRPGAARQRAGNVKVIFQILVIAGRAAT